MVFDQADATMPMIASRSATTVVELRQRLGPFLQNTMIEKIAGGFHEIFAWAVHGGLLLIDLGT